MLTVIAFDVILSEFLERTSTANAQLESIANCLNY
jgi:hypothetical protein